MKKPWALIRPIFRVYVFAQGRPTLNVGSSILLAGFQDWAKWGKGELQVSTSTVSLHLPIHWDVSKQVYMPMASVSGNSCHYTCTMYCRCAFPAMVDYTMCQNKPLYPRKGLTYPRLATSSMNVRSFCFGMVLGIEPWASCMLGKHSTDRATSPAQYFL